MTDEYTQAISFTNSYFALVDGLASGLQNHLAEDVILDWFGKTIRGRENVTAFIEAHKVNSRHMFSNIMPSSSIGYKKKPSNRKKHFSYQSRIIEEKDADNFNLNGNSRFPEPESSSPRDGAKNLNRNEIDPKETTVTDDMSYDLNEGDLSNLFKLEITSTSIEEIERSINRIKLEEEMAPTIKAIKRECGQGDGPAVVETSTIKYVEANGEIEFSRKLWKRDSWSNYSSATPNVHTWRRSCKIQIAYSALTEPQPLEVPRKKKNSTWGCGQSKGRLPSLEEISEISGRLVPNVGGFGGLLKPFDFIEDRNEFLECLEMEMSSKNPDTSLLSPQYVENKLVFDKPSVDLDNHGNRGKKKFIFNYQIHLIIYEGVNRCRMNLLRQFEKTNI